MTEFELIRQAFLDRLPFRHPQTRLPAGDDASVHGVPDGFELVVSTDMAVAGTHWPQDFPLPQAASRAVNAALSDLAAMGAEACWLWCSVAAADGKAAAAIGDGVAAALAGTAIELAGGDTVLAASNCLSLTVAGLVPQGEAMRRDTAEVGEDLWLCGHLGKSAYALQQWQAGDHSQQVAKDFARVRPLLAEGQVLREAGVRCCIDVSDGLLADAGHVAELSGVGMLIDVARIPGYAHVAGLLGEQAAAHLVLAGGEDYALLCSAPQGLHDVLADMAVRIGRCTAETGVRAELDGEEIEPVRRGFDHFAGDA